jgi:hypothetical protein
LSWQVDGVFGRTEKKSDREIRTYARRILMRGSMMRLTTFFIMCGLLALLADDTCLPLVCIMIAIVILNKVADALEE